jgi:hypothetical protein
MSHEDQPSPIYSCHTQKGFEPTIGPTLAAHLPERKGGGNQLVLGLGRIIPRWDVSDGNTQLQYFVKARSFPSASVAQLAAKKLQEAADEWNSLNLGLTISEAPDKESAHFDLVFETNAVVTKQLSPKLSSPMKRSKT